MRKPVIYSVRSIALAAATGLMFYLPSVKATSFYFGQQAPRAPSTYYQGNRGHQGNNFGHRRGHNSPNRNNGWHYKNKKRGNRHGYNYGGQRFNNGWGQRYGNSQGHNRGNFHGYNSNGYNQKRRYSYRDKHGRLHYFYR